MKNENFMSIEEINDLIEEHESDLKKLYKKQRNFKCEHLFKENGFTKRVYFNNKYYVAKILECKKCKEISYLLTNDIDIKDKEKPYLENVKVIKRYNPDYGDNRICECGDEYYRHFDSYEDMYPCGCKYCNCNTFKEKLD